MNREEAISRIQRALSVPNRLQGLVLIDEESANMAIEALSEKPKGEWLHVEIIDDDDPRGINDDASECSICGFTHNSYYWASTYYNFCPNCGVRMKGGDAEVRNDRTYINEPYMQQSRHDDGRMTMIEIPLKRRGIIYCEDCKHRCTDGEVTHYYWCRLHDRPVDDTDYCSWGEESEVEE